MVEPDDRRGGGRTPSAAARSSSSRKNIRTPRVSSVAARVRFQCSVAPDTESLLSTSATGSGFSATRSSRRCILPMSAVAKAQAGEPLAL